MEVGVACGLQELNVCLSVVVVCEEELACWFAHCSKCVCAGAGAGSRQQVQGVVTLVVDTWGRSGSHWGRPGEVGLEGWLSNCV